MKALAVQQVQPEQVQVPVAPAVLAVRMEGTEAAHFLVQVVFMAAGQAALVILAVTLVQALSVLFGPELRARSRALTQGIYNA